MGCGSSKAEAPKVQEKTGTLLVESPEAVVKQEAPAATTEAAAPLVDATAEKLEVPAVGKQSVAEILAPAEKLVAPAYGSAPRPSWLPSCGPGQANVDPLQWGLSIEQWIFFVRACVATDVWKALVAGKGEYNITMYDIKDYFVVPWTAGTGSSISLLMNGASSKKVELMISHAWGGSVLEVYNCLQNLVNHEGVPSSTPVFYCTFSMYQPEDGFAGGLTIDQQLTRKPFATIIESNPKHGMFIIHTSVFEVYSRMWTVHEVDEAMLAEIRINGLFDLYRWEATSLQALLAIDTEKSECRPENRLLLSDLIIHRGGFSRLNNRIVDVRKTMVGQLEEFLNKFKKIDEENRGYEERDHDFRGDWWKGEVQVDRDAPIDLCIEWKFHKAWKEAMRRVVSDLNIAGAEKFLLEAYPLGKDALPFGPAVIDVTIACPDSPPGWDI